MIMRTPSQDCLTCALLDHVKTKLANTILLRKVSGTFWQAPNSMVVLVRLLNTPAHGLPNISGSRRCTSRRCLFLIIAHRGAAGHAGSTVHINSPAGGPRLVDEVAQHRQVAQQVRGLHVHHLQVLRLQQGPQGMSSRKGFPACSTCAVLYGPARWLQGAYFRGHVGRRTCSAVTRLLLHWKISCFGACAHGHGVRWTAETLYATQRWIGGRRGRHTHHVAPACLLQLLANVEIGDRRQDVRAAEAVHMRNAEDAAQPQACRHATKMSTQDERGHLRAASQVPRRRGGGGGCGG